MSYKEHLESLDIIVVYNRKSWLHKMIKKVTDYKAGHVALYAGEGKIYEASSIGIVYKKCKNYNKNTRIYLCRVNNMTVTERFKVVEYCQKSIGLDYAYFQLIVMLFKYLFRLKRVPDVSKKAMICSEFVVRAFENADINLSFKPSWEVTPGDILESKKVEKLRCQ